MKQNLYSQQGGMGFRGSGEKQIELDRRRIRRQLTQAKRELAMIEKQRQTQRQLRKHHQEKVVCLVGYTNSGKSSLLNALTSKRSMKRYAFCDFTDIIKTCLYEKHHVIMSDTVGFIHQLPHSFVQSFRSTLEEVKDADLLIHVIDASSPYYHNQTETTLSVLKELDALDIPMIYVYNKMDLVHQPIVHEQGICIDVSVKEKKHLDDLENMIIDILFKDYELISVYIPYEEGHIFSEIEYQYEILHTEYLEKEIYVSFYVNQKHKQRYLPYMKKTDSLQ